MKGIIIKTLCGNNENIQQKSVFWNMTASLLNAVMSALLLLIVTRTLGIIQGGIFSIASTIAYQTLTLGNYGMRNFQVTDIKEVFSFNEYLSSRIITCLLMLFGIIYFAFFKDYPISKSLVILFFSLYKMIDAIEDVYHGLFQHKGRLDIAGKAQTIRYLFSIIVFAFLILFTRDLLIACIVTLVISFLLFIILNLPIRNQFEYKKSYHLANVIRLLKECFPLCAGAFLLLYVCNSPKYAIDKNLAVEFQTYFGVLFMPVFTINLLSSLIYRPMLTELANKWAMPYPKEFAKKVSIQIFIIIGFTIIALVGSFLLGIPVLEIVYSVQLDGYIISLLILILGGGFSALIGYFVCLITIFRKQNLILFLYGLVAVLSMFISDYFVVNYSILGASLLYFFLMMLLTLAFAIIVISTIMMRKKEYEG